MSPVSVDQENQLSKQVAGADANVIKLVQGIVQKTSIIEASGIGCDVQTTGGELLTSTTVRVSFQSSISNCPKA